MTPLLEFARVVVLHGCLACMHLFLRLDVTRFQPAKQHLKTLRRMEDFLSGKRPIVKVHLEPRGPPGER